MPIKFLPAQRSTPFRHFLTPDFSSTTVTAPVRAKRHEVVGGASPMAGKNGDDGGSDLGRNLAYGLEIAVGVTLGYFIGNWFDRRHGSAPWGLLVGVMLGLA